MNNPSIGDTGGCIQKFVCPKLQKIVPKYAGNWLAKCSNIQSFKYMFNKVKCIQCFLKCIQFNVEICIQSEVEMYSI